MERHRRVAERRAQDTVVMCHRGFSTLARENTLEAYAAAMDYGADGCEVDVRRTADGVLVLFHDDMLDRLTDGLGAASEVTYAELLAFKRRPLAVSLGQDAPPPTFAALLALARQRAMLLHLDVKEPGLDEPLRAALDAADMWDHVAAVNASTAPTLAKDPRIRPLRFRGPGLFEGRRDLDPDSVRKQLSQPGNAVMVDDPRLVVRELKRPAYRPVPLPSGLTRGWAPANAPAGAEPIAGYLRRYAGTDPTPKRLRALLETPPAAAQPDTSRAGVIALLDRAWAANRLGGEVCCPARETVRALERLVRSRSLHPDWQLQGLDGALAARALGRLGDDRSAEVLVEALRRIDPALEKVVNRQFGPYPLAWTDFRVKMHAIPALGELRSPAGKRFLLEYVRMDEKAARELMPDYRMEAAQALFRHRLTREELLELLRSPNLTVRGTAVLECLDRPNRARAEALREAAPWALELPRARAARETPS